MNRFIKLFKAYNDPMNNTSEQYQIIMIALRKNDITVEQAIDIFRGTKPIQILFNEDLEAILKENND